MQFKLVTLTFKALVARHLTDLLQHHQPTKSLRSSSSHQQLFRDIIYYLYLVLSATQRHGSGTRCLSAFPIASHFLLLNVI